MVTTETGRIMQSEFSSSLSPEGLFAIRRMIPFSIRSESKNSMT